MPEEEYTFTPASRLMQADEIMELASIFVKEGVNKIRLTGGEPLVRKDAKNILTALAKLPVKLTMTTNGTRLHEFTDVLEHTGIRSLNISLDTLQPDRFLLMTRRDQFTRVMTNINDLVQRGFHIKVNMVVMKGINDTEVLDFIRWTRDSPVHIRFIEFMPFSGNRWESDKVVTWQDIITTIKNEYEIVKLTDELHDTAKGYTIPGHAGTFAVISTMSAPFCEGCNRMRLTADGKMKNCLFSKNETDLLTALRNGEDVRSLIHACVAGKAKELGGQFDSDFKHLHVGDIDNRSMITIGG
jgi:cyclic pyranopterin phosphate synthase